MDIRILPLALPGSGLSTGLALQFLITLYARVTPYCETIQPLWLWKKISGGSQHTELTNVSQSCVNVQYYVCNMCLNLTFDLSRSSMRLHLLHEISVGGCEQGNRVC